MASSSRSGGLCSSVSREVRLIVSLLGPNTLEERTARERIAKHMKHLLVKRTKNLIEDPLIGVLSICKRARNALATSDNRAISKVYLRSRDLKRSIVGGKYSFVTINELVAWTTEWIKSFSGTYDLIVGIPRSGLLVANLISTKLGKPLTTPDLFNRNHYWMSHGIHKKGEYNNILLVDDSITNGKAMEGSLGLLHSRRADLSITKAALIATRDSKRLVDLHYKIIPHPRLFEWNLLHAKKGKLVSDMDGVICENCPTGVDSNERLYTKWVKTAKPHLIPVFEIDVIVSNRLEKYRLDTEEWLTRHGVRYKELILWNIESKWERNGKYARHKIECLLQSKPDMFWESDFSQATQIWRATRIPTLCLDEMILLS